MLAADEVHARWRGLAGARALDRLRRLRATRRGVVHPVDVTLREGRLAVQLEPGDLRVGPVGSHRSFAHWVAAELEPMAAALCEAHEAGVVGLGATPVSCGRWVPPPAWFLREGFADQIVDPEPDRQALRAWVASVRRERGEPRDGRDRRMLDSIVARLKTTAPPAVVQEQIGAELGSWRLDRGVPEEFPGILAFLTEAELLERLGTVHRYRILDRRDLDRMHLDAGDEVVLEVDPSWEDPHFTGLERPPIQDLWDELVADSRTIIPVILHKRLPNPLVSSHVPKDDRPAPRWVAVHEDQPLLFLKRGKLMPKKGWIQPVLPGDDALLKRKRAFVSFSGDHPALGAFLSAPPPARAFEVNDVARDALEDVILGARGVFVVQGPPGTGKTHLATEVVCRYLQRTPGGRVLVCSKEHFALGHIRRKTTTELEAREVPFRAYRSVSLARLSRSAAEADDPWVGRNAARDLAAREWSEDALGWLPWQAATADAHDQRLDGLARASANLFFCTTMDAAMVEFIDEQSFDLVIVEEAGKCYPSEILHAICLGRTALLIGDHLQLPPYQEQRTRQAVDSWIAMLRRTRDDDFLQEVKARFGQVADRMLLFSTHSAPPTDEERGWLRTFEFLWERSDDRFRLEEQFRMERALSDLVGRVFYGRPFMHRKQELIDAGRIPARPLGDLIPAPLDLPLVWIDTPHTTKHPQAGEDHRKEGVRDNQFELDLIVRYLRQLRPGCDPDFVILTPYRAQKRLLLTSSELHAACARLSPKPLVELVRTTDEYQGREAELTILSLVRNNAQGARAWGFMTELERLNVMFSRARFRQVVVGCGAHIERHAEEAPYLQRIWREYQDAAGAGTARTLTPSELRRG